MLMNLGQRDEPLPFGSELSSGTGEGDRTLARTLGIPGPMAQGTRIRRGLRETASGGFRFFAKNLKEFVPARCGKIVVESVRLFVT